jgi:hypothetical protein
VSHTAPRCRRVRSPRGWRRRSRRQGVRRRRGPPPTAAGLLQHWPGRGGLSPCAALHLFPPRLDGTQRGIPRRPRSVTLRIPRRRDRTHRATVAARNPL